MSHTDVSEMALFLAQQIVEDPSQVKVQGRGRAVTLHVAPGEEGRVIGRQGRVIGAIRTLVHAAYPHENIHIDLQAPRQ